MTEQEAYQLSEWVSYAEIATHALVWDISFEEAAQKLYNQLVKS